MKLSDEEKKAINKLKELSDFFDSKGLHTDNQVLMHFINKQQKELEELKSENETLKNTMADLFDVDRLKE